MKISEQTQLVLRNFANINQSILLSPGNRLSTMSVMRNMLASADVDVEFPVQFGIYDLPRFLGNLSIYPDIEFNEKYVLMSNGSKTYKFMAADPSIIVYPTTTFKMDNSDNNPDDAKEITDYDVSVTLTDATISTIAKVASINSLPDYALMTEDGTINFVALDKKSDTTDIAKEPVGESNAEFKLYFRAENMKLIEGDYNVSVSRQKISTFRHQTKDIQYWVTLEQDSVYND
jgi:hypothetical protein